MRLITTKVRRSGRHMQRPVATGVLIAAVLTASPFAAAATGDVLRQGIRNPTTSKETEIVGRFAYKPVKGGYVTRQSNTKIGVNAGGAAVYGCRTMLKPSSSVPCLRANNINGGGHAFQFNSVGDVAGTITTGPDPAVEHPGRPFTTNATGVATGLNADRLDDYHAADLIAAARADTMWAVLGDDGTLVRARGAENAAHVVGSGEYRVTFAQNLDGCSIQSSITRPNPTGPVPAPGAVVSVMLAVNHARAEIRTFDLAGNPSDRPVAVTVTC